MVDPKLEIIEKLRHIQDKQSALLDELEEIILEETDDEFIDDFQDNVEEM